MRPTLIKRQRCCTAGKALFAEPGYPGVAKRPELADWALSWNIAIRRKIIKALPPRVRDLAAVEEKAKAQARAWVEHPFHIKDRFYYRKVRCRGLKKNTAQLYSLFALANLVIVKKPLLAAAPALSWRNLPRRETFQG